MNNKKLAKNLILSVAAQAISLLTSFIVGLVVPKFIDEFQYSYWQIFLLYFNYVNIFNLGLLDGLLLKYSQYDYDQLDQEKMRSQFKILLIITSFFGVLISLISFIALKDHFFQIGLLIALGVLIHNIFIYNTHIFQMTNRINLYAVIVITQRLLYGLIVLALLILKIYDFYWFCLADIISKIIGCIASAFFNKGLYFGKSLSPKLSIKEAFSNISAGAFLMLANTTSILIIGGAKMVIQWRWDELVFGKLAFSFSISNLFLSFVTAIGVVLFPSLKRTNAEEYPALHDKLRGMITYVLIFVLIGYFPGCWLLKLWFSPESSYVDGLQYLAIFLPLIIFYCRKNLLTNNYLKVFRKERFMLFVNLTTLVVGFILFLICAYAFNSLEWMLYFLVLMIMLSSIVSEIVVMKQIGKLQIRHFIIEFAMTAIFIFSARYCSLWIGFAVYAVALLIYSVFYRKDLAEICKPIPLKLRKK